VTGKILPNLFLNLFLVVTMLLLLSSEHVVAFVRPGQGGYQINVYVEPAESVVVVYTEFNVNVSVANVGYEGLYGYQLGLNYDSSVLKCADLLFPKDHFLKPTDPQNLYIPERRINDTGGYAEVAATLLWPESAKVGNGTLLNIVFRAKEVGITNLTLSNCIFEGPESQLYEVTVLGAVVTVVLPDFNNDGKVDILDLTIIGQAFDSTLGDARWNPLCDVNHDSVINILDVAVTAKAYGKTVAE
jgi:hypothetical protein